MENKLDDCSVYKWNNLKLYKVKNIVFGLSKNKLHFSYLSQSFYNHFSTSITMSLPSEPVPILSLKSAVFAWIVRWLRLHVRCSTPLHLDHLDFYRERGRWHEGIRSSSVSHMRRNPLSQTLMNQTQCNFLKGKCKWLILQCIIISEQHPIIIIIIITIIFGLLAYFCILPFLHLGF